MAEAVAVSTVSTRHDYGRDGRASEIEIRLHRAEFKDFFVFQSACLVLLGKGNRPVAEELGF